MLVGQISFLVYLLIMGTCRQIIPYLEKYLHIACILILFLTSVITVTTVTYRYVVLVFMKLEEKLFEKTRIKRNEAESWIVAV
jgi:hypothetical protein